MAGRLRLGAIDRDRFEASIASWQAQLGHDGCFHLARRLYGEHVAAWQIARAVPAVDERFHMNVHASDRCGRERTPAGLGAAHGPKSLAVRSPGSAWSSRA